MKSTNKSSSSSFLSPDYISPGHGIMLVRREAVVEGLSKLKLTSEEIKNIFWKETGNIYKLIPRENFKKVEFVRRLKMKDMEFSHTNGALLGINWHGTLLMDPTAGSEAPAIPGVYLYTPVSSAFRRGQTGPRRFHFYRGGRRPFHFSNSRFIFKQPFRRFHFQSAVSLSRDIDMCL